MCLHIQDIFCHHHRSSLIARQFTHPFPFFLIPSQSLKNIFQSLASARFFPSSIASSLWVLFTWVIGKGREGDRGVVDRGKLLPCNSVCMCCTSLALSLPLPPPPPFLLYSFRGDCFFITASAFFPLLLLLLPLTLALLMLDKSSLISPSSARLCR